MLVRPRHSDHVLFPQNEKMRYVAFNFLNCSTSVLDDVAQPHKNRNVALQKFPKRKPSRHTVPEWIRKIARDGMMQLWFIFRAYPLEIPCPSMSLSVWVLDGWVFKCPTWWNPGVSDWWSFCGLEESSTSCCQEIGDRWNIPIHTKMSKIVDIVWSFPVDDEEDPQLKLDFVFFLGIPKYSNFSLGLQMIFVHQGAKELMLLLQGNGSPFYFIEEQLKGSHCWRWCVMPCPIIRW